MDDSPPRIEVQDAPQGSLLVAQGAWTASNLTTAAAWGALTAQFKTLRCCGRSGSTGCPTGWNSRPSSS